MSEMKRVRKIDGGGAPETYAGGGHIFEGAQ